MITNVIPPSVVLEWNEVDQVSWFIRLSLNYIVIYSIDNEVLATFVDIADVAFVPFGSIESSDDEHVTDVVGDDALPNQVRNIDGVELENVMKGGHQYSS